MTRPSYLEIRDTKFHKSRMNAAFIPSHRGQTEGVSAERTQHIHAQAAKTFFINDHGRPLRLLPGLESRFRCPGNTPESSGRPAQGGATGTARAAATRFSVERLLAWCRRGSDVRSQLPNLSVYLGHVGMVETYRYLSATPELLTIAGRIRPIYRIGETTVMSDTDLQSTLRGRCCNLLHRAHAVPPRRQPADGGQVTATPSGCCSASCSKAPAKNHLLRIGDLDAPAF